MRAAAIVMLALVAVCAAPATAALPRIRAVIVSGATGARLAETTGAAPRPLAAVIGDARGGWFAAGAHGVVRIRADGSRDPAFVAPDSTVSKLALAHGVLVTAGPSGLAFLRPATGAPAHPLLPLAPSGTTVSVSAIAASGPLVFVVGSNRRGRNGSSQLAFGANADTGTRTGFHPIVRAGVATGVAASGQVVYLAGTFGKVAGAARCGLAAVTVTSGALRAWHPSSCLHGTPNAMLATASTLFVGRLHGFLALRSDTGAQLTWSTRVSQALAALGAGSLARSGHTLYVGTVADAGPVRIAGRERSGYLALDTRNGNLRPWRIVVARFQNGKLLAVSGTRVLAYGSFRA